MANLNGIRLTENEIKVLTDLYNSASGNGHDFGFTDEVTAVPKRSVPGVVASLSKKGVIKLHPGDVNGRPVVQFTWGKVSAEEVETFLIGFDVR